MSETLSRIDKIIEKIVAGKTNIRSKVVEDAVKNDEYFKIELDEFSFHTQCFIDEYLMEIDIADDIRFNIASIMDKKITEAVKRKIKEMAPPLMSEEKTPVVVEVTDDIGRKMTQFEMYDLKDRVFSVFYLEH